MLTYSNMKKHIVNFFLLQITVSINFNILTGNVLVLNIVKEIYWEQILIIYINKAKHFRNVFL